MRLDLTALLLSCLDSVSVRNFSTLTDDVGDAIYHFLQIHLGLGSPF